MATAAQSYSNHDDLMLSDENIQSQTPSLVSRLHPELLQIVFIHCACDHYADPAFFFETGAAPSWVNVSYVCRYWRDVALACPALWSYLFTASPRWTEELLVRSKQAPLKVQVNLLFMQIEQALCFWGQVTIHLARIQELNLDIHDGRLETEFYPILCARAPRLRRLRIVVSGGPDTERLPVLFEGDTPALCTLELSRSSVPWYSFGLSGLTTLGLYKVHIPDQQSVSGFLATLRPMQHLENLYLMNALPSSAASGFRSNATSHPLRVDLPHLSRLLIVAPISTVVAFLAGVNIPSKTKLRLDCSCEASIDTCISLFSVLGNQQAPSAPSTPWRSLVIEHAASPSPIAFTFSALEHDVDPLHPWRLQWTSSTPIKIRLRLRWLVPHLVGAVLSSVSLSDVHVLHVLTPQYAPEFWRAILGALPAVRAIRLSSGNLPDLASVLAHPPRPRPHPHRGRGRGCGGHADGLEHADEHADRILAPALEALDLHRVRLWVRPTRPAFERIGDLTTLCEAIATRRGTAGRLVVNRWHGDVGASSGVRQSNMVGEWRGGRVRIRTVDRPRGLRM